MQRLAPVNPVSRWRWVSGAERSEVPFGRVGEVSPRRGGPLRAGGARGLRLEPRRAPRRLRAAPRHGDEDAPRGGGLRALRRRRPVIEETLDVPLVAHGVSTRDRALREYAACPRGTRVSDDAYLLATYLPGGLRRAPRGGASSAGRNASPHVRRRPRAPLGSEIAPAGLHVLGHSRRGDPDRPRLWPLPGRLRRRDDPWPRADRPPATPPPRLRAGGDAGLRVRPVRAWLWHWTMALSGVVLIATGLAVHGGKASGSSACPRRPRHNAFAVVLMLNSFLLLFYHLATKAIRNFIPSRLPHGMCTGLYFSARRLLRRVSPPARRSLADPLHGGSRTSRS